MNFSFSEEQNQFRDAIRRFMEDRSPSSEVRRQIESGDTFDRALWHGLVEDLGVCGIQVSEAAGGSGFGMTELGIVMEEMGRALCCAPYFSSNVLATEAVMRCADGEHRARLLPEIVSGRRLAALAVAGPDGTWAPEVRVDQSHFESLINGTSYYVVGGCEADLLLVVARDAQSQDDEMSLYAVDADADGVTRRSLEVIDPTRPQAEVRFDNAVGRMISDGRPINIALSMAFDRAAVALANEMVGGAGRLLEMSVEYAKMRMQFGRLIGSFQAVKHKCADMLLDVELSKSAAYYAAEAADKNDRELSALASLALASAAETYMRTAAECIQLHGGIGFTWDHDAHLWYRRAKSSEVLLGTPDQHRERYLVELEACA